MLYFKSTYTRYVCYIIKMFLCIDSYMYTVEHECVVQRYKVYSNMNVMCSSPIVYCNMNAKVMRSVMSFKLSRLCLIQCTSTSVATLLVFVVVLAVRPYCARLPSRVVIGQSDKSGRIDDLIAERHHQRRQRQ